MKRQFDSRWRSFVDAVCDGSDQEKLGQGRLSDVTSQSADLLVTLAAINRNNNAKYLDNKKGQDPKASPL